MILARQCNEPGSRYPRCDFTAQFDWDHDVIPDMYDERRRGDTRQGRSNVKVVYGLVVANGAFGIKRFLKKPPKSSVLKSLI